MDEPKQSDFLKALQAISTSIDKQTAEIKKRFNNCVEECLKNGGGAVHIIVDGGNVNTKAA